MTQRILVPVDGSKPSERAVRHVIGLHAAGMALEVLLLNVQPGREAADSRNEAAARATRSARALLKAAQVAHENRVRVGSPAAHIATLARAARCRHIVMGMRGLGAVAGALLGSVSQGTLQRARVPVTLVK